MILARKQAARDDPSCLAALADASGVRTRV